MGWTETTLARRYDMIVGRKAAHTRVDDVL